MFHTRTLSISAALLAASFAAGCNTATTASTAAATAAATPSTATTPTPSTATTPTTTTTQTQTAEGSSDFLTAFNATNGLVATTVPLSGTANYAGQVEIRTSQDATDADNVVYGDLALAINFDANTNPIDMTVNNLSGTIGGTATNISGTLSSNGSNGLNVVNETQILGRTSTSLAAMAEGTLTDPTGTLTGDARMSVTGTMRGTNGEGITGANSVIITNPGSPNFTSGGRVYADKQ